MFVLCLSFNAIKNTQPPKPFKSTMNSCENSSTLMSWSNLNNKSKKENNEGQYLFLPFSMYI